MDILTAEEAAALARSIIDGESIPKSEIAESIGVHRNNIHTALRSTKQTVVLDRVLEALGFGVERVYRLTGGRKRERRSIYGIGSAAS